MTPTVPVSSRSKLPTSRAPMTNHGDPESQKSAKYATVMLGSGPIKDSRRDKFMIHRSRGGRLMIRDYFWLSDDQFARLQPLLPTDTRGKPRVDDRRVISGIVHVLKSGGRWIDAPEVYGPRKTLYNRFVRWAAKGVWVDMFHALAAAGGPPAQVLIDSSAVKAHRCAAGAKGGSALRRSAARVAAEPQKSML